MKLYDELADWWPLVSDPADYADEAAFFAEVLRKSVSDPLTTVLELGSGGGNNAFHLKNHFMMTLVDLAPAMLRVSQQINPECAHIAGDMRDVRLGREFDAVFVHDAIMYMTSEDDLHRALRTAFVHCRLGGTALFVPDWVQETFSPATQHGGHDGLHRSLRYLEWIYDPDPADTTCVTDFVYAMRDEQGTTRVEQDRHINGLFPRETWLRTLRGVGFEPHLTNDPYGREIFVAEKPWQIKHLLKQDSRSRAAEKKGT